MRYPLSISPMLHYWINLLSTPTLFFAILFTIVFMPARTAYSQVYDYDMDDHDSIHSNCIIQNSSTDPETPGPFFSHKYPEGELNSHFLCHEKLNVCQFTFKNGLKVNLAHLPNQPQSLVALKFGKGSLAEDPNNLGFSWLANSTFLKGGTQQHTWNELACYLNENEMDLRLEAVGDSFLLLGQAPKAALLPFLSILAAYVAEPGFSFANLTFQEPNPDIDTTRISPQALLKRRLYQLTQGNDRRFFQPTQKDLQAWSEAQFKEKMLEAIHSHGLELSIVGSYLNNNMDLQTLLLDPVKQTLGAIPIKTDAIEAPSSNSHYLEEPALIEHIVSPNPDSQSTIACVYWHTIDSNDREIFRSLRVVARFYCDAVQEHMDKEFDSRYTVNCYCEGGVHLGKGILAVYAEVAPEDAEQATALMLSVASNLIHATSIRKECFHSAIENTLSQFGHAFIEKSKELDQPITPLDDSLRPLLTLIIDHARGIVNIPKLTTDEVLRALRANFYAIGHNMNVLSHYSSEVDIEAQLNRNIYNFTELLTQVHAEHTQSSHFGEDKLHKGIESLKKELMTLFDKKSATALRIDQLYIEANRQVFLLKQNLRHFLREYKNSPIASGDLVDIQIAVEHIQKKFNALTMDDILANEKLEDALTFSLGMKEVLNDALQHHPKELRHVQHTLKETLSSIDQLLSSIKQERTNLNRLKKSTMDSGQLLLQLLQKIGFTEAIEDLNDMLIASFSDWMATSRALAQFRLAKKALEALKLSAIWNAWRLLNPYSPSDGRRDPRDNTLGKAIQEELNQILETTHTPDYWLKDVLVGSQEHPERLVWSESIIQDYESVALRDVIILIRFALQPEKVRQIHIISKPLKAS